MKRAVGSDCGRRLRLSRLLRWVIAACVGFAMAVGTPSLADASPSTDKPVQLIVAPKPVVSEIEGPSWLGLFAKPRTANERIRDMLVEASSIERPQRFTRERAARLSLLNPNVRFWRGPF